MYVFILCVYLLKLIIYLFLQQNFEINFEINNSILSVVKNHTVYKVDN